MNKFLKEIEEQPVALKDTFSYFKEGRGNESLNRIVYLWRSGKYNKIVFTGMGSSYFISSAATYLLNLQNITSIAINAGELLHYQFSLLDKATLLICISQSGESYEIVKILEKLSSEITVIAISNEPGSTLVKRADESLLTMAGKEDMTSTKTFISSYLVIFFLALAFERKFNTPSFFKIEETIQVVSDLLKNRNQWLDEAVKTIAHAPFVQLIGRGPIFASVQQSSLMLMEATRNPASALLGGEFRHGPMEMVKNGFRAVIFAPSGTTYNQSISVTRDILKFNGTVLLLTDRTPLVKNANLFTILIPPTNEILFAISSIIPMQLIVNQWSIEEKNEPGNFMRGAKITSVE
jgi:glucosamine--fructose-6-phosphate aminotransferase (isomerizing)